MNGPTEATVDCVSCHVTDTSLTGVNGRSLPNNRPNPTPIGVEGKLSIGSIQFTQRGYLNEPDLTASSFVVNPFVPGERIYHTGDIAMYRSDGNIV
jgi:non-ribosomal peptide synthetase component F